ncbi:hypothetical protein, partial [Caldibacillus thermoamylovorans]|uniref:hypothetical protein n=1 Tax=Caldibacillus thermoamylovorans TaxID=35841 RepID=UPI0005A486A1
DSQAKKIIELCGYDLSIYVSKNVENPSKNKEITPSSHLDKVHSKIMMNFYLRRAKCGLKELTFNE